jgi:hypothetical protein
MIYRKQSWRNTAPPIPLTCLAVFPLPAPAEQTQAAEAGSKERFAVNIPKQPRISRISAIKPEDRAFGVRGTDICTGR